jgi:hypothetical protein
MIRLLKYLFVFAIGAGAGSFWTCRTIGSIIRAGRIQDIVDAVLEERDG